MTTFSNRPDGDASPSGQLPVSYSPNNHGRLGWTACIMTAVSVVLMMSGDPLGLALVCALSAVIIAAVAARRGQIDHAGTQLGLSLGIFLVLGWFVIRIFSAFLESGASV